MEIRPGYKQTEVGVIPEDWECKKINNICDVKGGRRLPKGYQLTKNNTGQPYIRVLDMFMGGVNMSEILFVPNEAVKTIKNYRITKNDLFISVAGTLGIVGQIPEKLDGANLTENANKLCNIKCDKQYLLYCLMSKIIQNVINNTSTLGAQPKLALTRIQQFYIPFPQITEQQAIASALSDIDSLISSLTKLIEKKKNIKQGTMQELLTGKRRLEGFGGKWSIKKISEIFEIKTGTSKSHFINDGGCNFIVDMGSVSVDGKLIVSKKTNLINDCLNYGDLIMPKDDIGGGKIIGKVAFIDRNNKYVLGDHIYALTTKLGCSKFFSYMINSNLVNQELKKKVSGSAQLGLSKQSLESQTIYFPNLEEQEAIASILSDMDTEIEALEQKLNKYKNIKQGMMQELLTGRIRLVEEVVS